jgi:hypothetical protein
MATSNQKRIASNFRKLAARLNVSCFVRCHGAFSVSVQTKSLDQDFSADFITRICEAAKIEGMTGVRASAIDTNEEVQSFGKGNFEFWV